MPAKQLPSFKSSFRLPPLHCLPQHHPSFHMAYTPESLEATYEKYDELIKQAIFDGTIHQTMSDHNAGIVCNN
jgi:hypothetical protein